jgi:hypothetical protein
VIDPGALVRVPQARQQARATPPLPSVARAAPRPGLPPDRPVAGAPGVRARCRRDVAIVWLGGGLGQANSVRLDREVDAQDQRPLELTRDSTPIRSRVSPGRAATTRTLSSRSPWRALTSITTAAVIDPGAPRTDAPARQRARATHPLVGASLTPRHRCNLAHQRIADHRVPSSVRPHPERRTDSRRPGDPAARRRHPAGSCAPRRTGPRLYTLARTRAL